MIYLCVSIYVYAVFGSARAGGMRHDRLSSALAKLARLTNWEAAASHRAQMRPTPAACKDLTELLGVPQRWASGRPNLHTALPAFL